MASLLHKPLIKLLNEKKIIKYGDFILRSGVTSYYYCDIKEAFGYPVILNKITEELLKLIPENSTCIAGSGYGGIPLATLVARKKKLPLVLVRDKVKDYGTKKSIDGYRPNKKDVVCIIDDVYTTGSSISETRKKLSALKVKFTKPVVVLNRSKKRTILYLLDDEDLHVNNVAKSK